MIDNPFSMVAVIVVAVMIASVLRAKYRGRSGDRQGNVEQAAENRQLREEVKALKERIHVLERIAVEKEDTLSRQIEQLRDR